MRLASQVAGARDIVFVTTRLQSSFLILPDTLLALLGKLSAVLE